MNPNLYERATAVINAKHNKTTARRRGALDTAIIATVPVLAIAVAFASGWSLYDLGRHFHMPGWAAWSIFALIDVVWFQSAIVVIKNQRSPHRAIEAHKRMQGMFAVSVAANFAHGLILLGATPSGFVAGAVFALFPIGFKTAFSNAFPDYVKRARKAGYGGELDKAFHTEALMFIMAGVDQAKAELDDPADTVHTVVRDSPDGASGRPDGYPDAVPDTSGRKPLTSQDTRPDPLRTIADDAAGPSDLVRALSGHGVHADDLVKTATRLRPDMNADSIRRTAKRITGPYL